MCQRLGNVRPEKLLDAIEHLPSQKWMEELEAKVSFLQEKNKKTDEELKEEKEVHRKAVDKLNLSFAFNQKLEAYVGNTGMSSTRPSSSTPTLHNIRSPLRR